MGNYKGFSKVELRKPERSKFDLSHEKKLSTRMGKLVPVFISEALPNDTFRVNTEIMLRFAPLLAPIFHRVNVFVHFFFVPNRLLHLDWEKFITNGRLGDEVSPIPPYVLIQDVLGAGADLLDVGSLADYLGVAPIADSETYGANDGINLMPFTAYWKCWYDYYRDRNYVADSQDLPQASGNFAWSAVIEDFMSLKTRAWQHDYFTSALPWTQRGDEVLIPMEFAVTDAIIRASGLPPVAASKVNYDNTGELVNDTPVPISLVGDNSSASVNDLRQAVVLQQWLERNAVAGSRYSESIMAHFARRTSDGRLQRAEYLGGGRVPVAISEVMTTAWSQDGASNDVPPATMSGRGATYSNKNSFKYNCEEHGFILGIMSVMPTSGYMNGTKRMFYSRNTFLDYPWPSFAHLGEQQVYNYEIFQSPSTVPDYGAEPSGFGYQSRYADWKYISNSAHGDFRSTLDYWHLDRKFATLPTLGDTFVKFEDELQDRIFAVSNVDTLWCYIHNQASVVRSLPYFGTPRL